MRERKGSSRQPVGRVAVTRPSWRHPSPRQRCWPQCKTDIADADEFEIAIASQRGTAGVTAITAIAHAPDAAAEEGSPRHG